MWTTYNNPIWIPSNLHTSYNLNFSNVTLEINVNLSISESLEVQHTTKVKIDKQINYEVTLGMAKNHNLWI